MNAHESLFSGLPRIGEYRTIVADPPWEQPDSGARTQSTNGNWRGKWLGYVSEIPYPRMPLDEIKALPIADLAAKDAHLYLWTTNRFLEDAWDVVRAWGFKPSTMLQWCKAPMGIGLGGAFTITTEYVLFARRGSLAPAAACRFDVVEVEAPVQRERRSCALQEARRLPRPRRAGIARSAGRAVQPPRPSRMGHLGQRVPGRRRGCHKRGGGVSGNSPLSTLRVRWEAAAR